jgi:hypothetical protein
MAEAARTPAARLRLRSSRARARSRPGLPSLKVVLFTLVLLVLVGTVGFAASRESARVASPVRVQPALPTPRPALSPDEQSYIEALWPIHTDVERNAVRVALGASFYKLRDLSRAELRTRLDDALKAYRADAARLRSLRPPSSFQTRHAAYLTALQLFEQSTDEMLRMYDDGSEEHLTRGFPLSVEGSDKVREVGESFWPDEYPPN